MDTWVILTKELSYYGIRLAANGQCQFFVNGQLQTQGIIKTIRQIGNSIKHHKGILAELLKNVASLLNRPQQSTSEFIDERMTNLFKSSLKELSMFLMCFDGIEAKQMSNVIDNALSRDVKSFDKEQIYKLPDYKISIDWIHRLISRFLYLRNLLYVASIGRKHITKYVTNKVASGISGPWANLDLPMQERVYPFESEELQGISKDKEKQRRYRKGLENYNGDGRVQEGHYWRELRNEPYSWEDRETESPYPSRYFGR